MKDQKRDVLKKILQGSLQGTKAASELQDAKEGKTTVTVWIEDPQKGLWRKMDSDEVQTYEEHEAHQKNNPHIKVIRIGGNHHE